MSNRVSYSLSLRNILSKLLNERPDQLDQFFKTSQSVAKLLNPSNVILESSYTGDASIVCRQTGHDFNHATFAIEAIQAAIYFVHCLRGHVSSASENFPCMSTKRAGVPVGCFTVVAWQKRGRGETETRNPASMTASLSSLFSHFLSLPRLADRTRTLALPTLCSSVLSSFISNHVTPIFFVFQECARVSSVFSSFVSSFARFSRSLGLERRALLLLVPLWFSRRTRTAIRSTPFHVI